MNHVLHKFDSIITKWIAVTFTQRARSVFLIITMLGDPLSIGIITLSLIGYGIIAPNYEIVAFAVMIPLTVLIGALLKILFERARPATEYALNMKLQTFSFPSGHSSGSTIAFGVLSVLAFTSPGIPSNGLIGSLLALVPISVGISRVYLGAHFPSDVIAGWLLGIASLAVLILVVRPLV